MFTKTHITVLIAASLLGLSMTACHFDIFEEWGADLEKKTTPAETTVMTETTPTPSLPARAIVGEFNSGQALTLLYGDYDTTTQRARWQPTNQELNRFGYGTSVKNVFSSVLLAAPYNEGAAEKYLVLTRTTPQPGTCRNCAPVLGGAVYQRNYTGDTALWLPVSESQFITKLENADRWSGRIVRLGPSAQGALLHWRFTNNGFVGAGEMLVSVRENNLRTLFSLISSGSNEAECDDADATKPPCWKYDSTLAFQRGAHAAYDDLIVTRQGTKLSDEGEIVSAQQTQRYVYLNGAYVAQRAEARGARPRP
jgi:hypothetical protein